VSRRPSADAARRADAALLTQRLTEVGLTGMRGVEVHENRTVLVSVTGRGVLRVHRGYAYATDETLEQLVAFVHPAMGGRRRRKAEDVIAAFPVHDYVQEGSTSRRPTRPKPTPRADRPLIARLRSLHSRLNTRHFGGSLSQVPFRISDRMETRLGELAVDASSNAPLEIAISRRHIEEDGWNEVGHTLLHEMVHQWQVESGMEPDHGREFRRKAKAVGIAPSANRTVEPVAPAIEHREEQGWLFEVSTSTTSTRS
jgi:hypothetical protein